MSRYTETANYDLRKPQVNSVDSENVWGVDINRNIVALDAIIKGMETLLSSAGSDISALKTTTLPALLSRLQAVESTISSYEARITPYMDNPDCTADVTYILSRLSDMHAWADATITRLQRFIADNYYYTGQTDITDYDTDYTLKATFDNGLLKSHVRSTS